MLFRPNRGGVRSDVGRDALGELLHQVDLRVVLEQREVAARHELDGHAGLVPDVEQRLDELVGACRRTSSGASAGASSGRSNGGGDGGWQRPGRRGLHVGVLPVHRPDGVAVASERLLAGRAWQQHRVVDEPEGRRVATDSLALVEHPATCSTNLVGRSVGEDAVGEARSTADRGLRATADQHRDAESTASAGHRASAGGTRRPGA